MSSPLYVRLYSVQCISLWHTSRLHSQIVDNPRVKFHYLWLVLNVTSLYGTRVTVESRCAILDTRNTAYIGIYSGSRCATESEASQLFVQRICRYVLERHT